MRSDRALGLAVVLGAAAALAEPLVGPSVGNADTLAAEGSKHFNHKDYAKAAAAFLKATRANPANVGTYLQLARAASLAKDLNRSCYAYRVFLKVAPETAEKKKATTESDQCERQLKAQPNQKDFAQTYSDERAAFFAAVDGHSLLGSGGAEEHLRALVRDGFMGPELGEMAQKLALASVAEADAIHAKAMALEAVPAAQLRSARPLYQLAAEVGTAAPEASGRSAFLDGLADLTDQEAKKAEAAFVEAMKADPGNKNYAYYRAMAVAQTGDRAAALKLMETELPDDPRTHVLRVAVSLGNSPEAGAAELEKLLFRTRVPAEK